MRLLRASHFTIFLRGGRAEREHADAHAGVEKRVRFGRVRAVVLPARNERVYDCFSDTRSRQTFAGDGDQCAGGRGGEWVVVVFDAGYFEHVAWVAAGVQDLCVETHLVLVCGFGVRWYDWLAIIAEDSRVL